MFKLFRRLSSSVYQRPDRPWSEDATSNAPTIGRKRRMDDDEEDQVDTEATTSRKRRGQLQREDTATSDFGEVLSKGKETDPEVKEVTQGVKEFDIEETKKEGNSTGAQPSDDLERLPGADAAVEASTDLPDATRDVPENSPADASLQVSDPAEIAAPTANSPVNPLEMPLPAVDADEDAALAAQPPSSPAPASVDSSRGESPPPDVSVEKKPTTDVASVAEVPTPTGAPAAS